MTQNTEHAHLTRCTRAQVPVTGNTAAVASGQFSDLGATRQGGFEQRTSVSRSPDQMKTAISYDGPEARRTDRSSRIYFPTGFGRAQIGYIYDAVQRGIRESKGSRPCFHFTSLFPMVVLI